MLNFLATLLATLPSILRSRAALELENLVLRHQIGVLQRSAGKRAKLTPLDRLLWVWLSRIWGDWRSALAIVQPETVIAWHRRGFGLFWAWKIRRGQPGRATLPHEVGDLIRRMCRENPTWGATRIHGELLKFGINISETSVSKYMLRSRKPPSQGRKSPSYCIGRLRVRRFDSVTEASELPDHSRRAPLLRLFIDSRATFLVTDTLMQHQPDQATLSMGNGPDGLIMSKTRDRAAIDNFEDASFGLYGGIGSLVEKATHVAVALGRPVAIVHSRALFVSRTRPHPRGEILGGRKGRRGGSYPGDDRRCRIRSQAGHLR